MVDRLVNELIGGKAEMVATDELLAPGQAWRRLEDDVLGWLSDEGDAVSEGMVRWVEDDQDADGKPFGVLLSRIDLVGKYQRDVAEEARLVQDEDDPDWVDPYLDDEGLDNAPDPRQGQVLGLEDLPDGYSDSSLDDGFRDEQHQLPSYLDDGGES